MGTKVIADMIDTASQLLSDLTNVSWSRTELLRWLNDGLLQMAVHAPATCARTADVTLAGNKAKQVLPDDCLLLLTVFQEVGGGALTAVDRGAMNRENRKWMQATPGELLHYMYESDDPNVLYVYPPARAGAVLNLSYAAQLQVAGEGSVLPVADAYATALINYIVYRAFSKNSEAAGNPSAAGNFYQAFMSALGAAPKE